MIHTGRAVGFENKKKKCKGFSGWMGLRWGFNISVAVVIWARDKDEW